MEAEIRQKRKFFREILFTERDSFMRKLQKRKEKEKERERGFWKKKKKREREIQKVPKPMVLKASLIYDGDSVWFAFGFVFEHEKEENKKPTDHEI